MRQSDGADGESPQSRYPLERRYEYACEPFRKWLSGSGTFMRNVVADASETQLVRLACPEYVDLSDDNNVCG